MFLLPPRSPWSRFLLSFCSFQPSAAWPQALGEAMRLKPADTKQDMFVQVHVTLERGSEMFSHVPSSASPIYGGHLAACLWLLCAPRLAFKAFSTNTTSHLLPPEHTHLKVPPLERSLLPTVLFTHHEIPTTAGSVVGLHGTVGK